MNPATVSWPKDRERYRPVLRELPVFRFLRMVMTWSVVASALALAAMVWLRAGPASVAIALVPGALGVYGYLSCRRSVLAGVGAGRLSWRLDSEGLRIEGGAATEIPWSQMVRWRRGAGHLIIEMKRPGGRRANPAVAAPLEAFGPEDWERAEAILRSQIGPEAP